MLRQSCERRLVAALRLVVLTTVSRKYPESDGGLDYRRSLHLFPFRRLILASRHEAFQMPLECRQQRVAGLCRDFDRLLDVL